MVVGVLDACAGRVGGVFPGAHRQPEQLHLPTLGIPPFTRNGAHVPIVIEVASPMEPDHYISSLQILNEGDPIPSKGTFHLTPANGQAYLATQARMRSGTSSVVVIAECTQHGRSVARQSITIPEGGEGCASAAGGRDNGTDNDDIRPPVIRIPALVARGSIRRGEIVQVQLQVKHPSRTGLALRGQQYVQEREPFYIRTMEVFYGDRLVSRFEMTPAGSDNPFITFKLLATEERHIGIVLTNSRGRRFEATEEVALS